MIRTLVISLTALSFGLTACSEPETKIASEVASTMIPKSGDITTSTASELTSAGHATLIDVRRPREWKSTGVARGAIGATLQDRDFIEQILTATNGDKTRPVALICRSGNRSQTAANKLKAAGYTTVLNVAGGMKDWKKQGLPTEDCRTC